MYDCPGDKVRRYPPAPPPAGAHGPPLDKANPAEQPAQENKGDPMQVDPKDGNKTRREKADQHPPPGLDGPEQGVAG